ncbi:hypothetical protein RJ639_021308 [Escallonia herrerae]|uniref:Transposase MuDR plant domain-containing protein n=1 Tax=Escallonia herrerae TaxID=1293975 RepID=A0AA88V7Q4_9ASTE|nr:hypothetical protein RJ639_021308 [Escallonia herrerae]
MIGISRNLAFVIEELDEYGNVVLPEVGLKLALYQPTIVALNTQDQLTMGALENLSRVTGTTIGGAKNGSSSQCAPTQYDVGAEHVAGSEGVTEGHNKGAELVTVTAQHTEGDEHVLAVREHNEAHEHSVVHSGGVPLGHNEGNASVAHNMGASGGNPYIEVGMIFANNKVFKDVVKQYSINKARPIKFTKNMRTKIRVVCKSEDCGWFVYASAHDKSISVQIKTAGEKHTCGRQHINRAAGSKWLAKKYMDRFVG